MRPALFLLTFTMGLMQCHGQYCGLSSKELKTIPFDRLTLVVTTTGSAELDHVMDSVLRAEWKLTSTFEIAGVMEAEGMRSDTGRLFLDLYHMTWSTSTQTHRDAGTWRTTSTPMGPTMTHQPGETHTTSQRVAVMDRERFLLATEEAGVVHPPPGFEGTFTFHSPHDNDMNEGYAGLTRGHDERWKFRLSDPGPLDAYALIAYCPLDLWGRERYGVVDRYRLGMILRALQQAVDLGLSKTFTGGAGKVTGDMERMYRTRMPTAKGKDLLLPDHWLTREEEGWFTSRFNGRLKVAEGALVQRLMEAKDGTHLLLLPLGQRIHLYDMATRELVYVFSTKPGLSEKKVAELDRIWRMNER